jgi:hypothetical protein
MQSPARGPRLGPNVHAGSKTYKKNPFEEGQIQDTIPALPGHHLGYLGADAQRLTELS